jgi:hypothetical protein
MRFRNGVMKTKDDQMQNAILLDPSDNVLVAPYQLNIGDEIEGVDGKITSIVPAGHKIARRHIFEGEAIFKHATHIGVASCEISAGEWIHTHNISAEHEEKNFRFASNYRKPSALSGGQRQRVAIGRALVRDVDVFLFDEPLSNLDAKLRADLRIEIKQLHQKLHNTMIYVTHDQIEAMTLADRIAIMKGGKILQLASPDEIYNKPKVKYVAEFIGSPTMNFMNGSISSNQFTSDLFDCALDDYESDQLNFSGEAILGVRAEHILSGESASLAQVQLKGSVELLEPLGSDILARVNVDGSLFWVRLDGQSNVSLNQELAIGFGTENIHLFDAVSEQRI